MGNQERDGLTPDAAPTAEASPGAEQQSTMAGAVGGRLAPGALMRKIQRRAIQRRAALGGAAGASPPPTTGSGSALPDDTRTKMESSFGTDLSQVRVHQGPQASQMGAVAYAEGNDLHFAPGQYQPGTPSGDSLIGHEVTHVVQQRSGRVAEPQGKDAAVVADASLESEADVAGERAARGEPSGVSVGTGAATGARQLKAEHPPAADGGDLGLFTITHYNFTSESDPLFAGSPKISARGLKEKHRAAFLKDVDMQGTGYADSGQYIHTNGDGSYGYGAGGAYGPPVAWKTIAVDPGVIKPRSEVEIDIYRDKGNFKANDTGGAIIGKHVDVFVGPMSRNETLALGTKTSHLRHPGVAPAASPSHDKSTAPATHVEAPPSIDGSPRMKHRAPPATGPALDEHGGEHAPDTGHGDAPGGYAEGPSLEQIRGGKRTHKGDRGDAVKHIQQQLGSVEVDGEFGAKTEEAVKQFQIAKHLHPVSGIVGPTTLQWLDKEQAGAAKAVDGGAPGATGPAAPAGPGGKIDPNVKGDPSLAQWGMGGAHLKALQSGSAIVQDAMRYLNIKYVWGGSDIKAAGGLDCSGFTHKVYSDCGMPVPLGWFRSQIDPRVNPNGCEQYGMKHVTSPTPGDVVIFGTAHIGVFVGNVNGTPVYISANHGGPTSTLLNTKGMVDIQPVSSHPTQPAVYFNYSGKENPNNKVEHGADSGHHAPGAATHAPGAATHAPGAATHAPADASHPSAAPGAVHSGDGPSVADVKSGKARLKQGDKGEAVAHVQKLRGVKQTMVYGPDTEAHIKKFQLETMQMKADAPYLGVVGKDTMEALESGAGAVSAKGAEQMEKIVEWAMNHNGGASKGHCWAYVWRYLISVPTGYGKITAACGVGAAYAYMFADFFNDAGNAKEWGIRKLSITNPYSAPRGAIVVVGAGSPGTSDPIAGDIAIAKGDGTFVNDGPFMSYPNANGAARFARDGGRLLGAYIPAI